MRANARMLGMALGLVGLAGAQSFGADAVIYGGARAGGKSFHPAPDAEPLPIGRSGYPRKDRHKNAAQVKRASIKARNVARHKGRA